MIDDRELLRRYADGASEEAFAEIVQRHTSVVYSAALRQLCGHEALARDVTQAVFVSLANQRHAAKNIMHLSAWLYATTRFTVSHVVRSERRRQARETEAHALDAMSASASASEAAELPQQVLDAALDALPEADREALLLRFFSGHSFGEIGGVLGTTEDAARMRVSRAIEKLRQHFAQQGIHSSLALISTALAAQAAIVPAGLTTSLATAALVAAKAAPASSLLLTLMSTKPIAWITTVAALAAGGFGFYQYREAHAANDRAVQTSGETAALRAALDDERRRSAELTQKVARATTEQNELRAQLNSLAAEKGNGSRPRPVAQPALSPMEEWKAKLAAGTPITGAIVCIIDGKPTPKPVQFVIGHETEIATEEGTYYVTPQLREDGAVKYKFELQEKGAAKRRSFPNVVARPWGSFTIGSGAAAIGFDSDIPEPKGEVK